MSDEKNTLENEQKAVQVDSAEEAENHEGHDKLAEMNIANLEKKIEQLEQDLLDKETAMSIAVSDKAVELTEAFQSKEKELKNSLNNHETTIQKLQSENSALTDERDELQNNNSILVEELTAVNNTVTDQKQTINDLQVEKESLVQENKALAEEKDTLQKSSMARHESIKELENYKEQVINSNNKIKNLEVELDKFRSIHNDIDTSETPSATFRIDIYKRQGEYNGRIIHTISQNKKAFQTIDKNIINSFIMDHLPKIEDQNDVPKEAQAEEKLSSDKLVLDFDIKDSDIKANQPFDIRLSVDKGTKTDDLSKFNCLIDFYARDMYTGAVTKILSKQSMPTLDKELLFVEKAHPLPSGTFRLEGAVFFRSKDGKPTPHLAKSPERFISIG
jgi:chromosome segregation ATPase